MSKYTMPPRQKMINLLYVILIAMLAINISADVLDGYKIMNKEFSARIEDVSAYNDTLKSKILTEGMPERRQLAIGIGNKADSVRMLLDDLKEDIAKSADKDDYKPGKIKAEDDLNAVPSVFLSATKGRGKELREALINFREYASACISDSCRRHYAASFLKVDSRSLGMSWEKETFSYLPAIGGIMVLNKLEENVLMTVAEAYQSLLFDADQSKMKQGQRYVLINEGQRVINDDGTIDLPAVSVSSSATSILYRNYDNAMNIFCAGITQDKLIASISSGKIYRKGAAWIANPGSAKQVTIAFECVRNNRRVKLFSNVFQVKPLPDPIPYLVYKDGNSTLKYYGSVPIHRSALANAIEVRAEAAEGPAMNFKVTGFETILIKANSNKISSAHSSGSHISEAQRNQISQIERGDKFYITSITVVGATGKKQIAPINTIIL